MQKSGTIFTTRTLKNLSEEHGDLTAQYEKQQRSLVKEVVAIAGKSGSLVTITPNQCRLCPQTASYTPILEVLDASVASLDVIVRFV